jgi:hypothetical protein
MPEPRTGWRRIVKPMTLYLRDGQRATDSARNLRDCAVDGHNIAGSSAGQSVRLHRNAHLAWAGTAETQLRNVFTDSSTWRRLYGDRYWHIRNLDRESPRAMELINDEANEQASWLEELADRLTRLADRLAAAPGQLTVLDTNILLHFEPPDQVDWNEVVGHPEVRLVLPLRVVEELDEKKYTARDNLADRARRLLSTLRSQLSPTAGGPVKLRDGVTIEVPIDDGPRARTLDADQEILDVCHELGSGGQPVLLVSADTGMWLRATALGIEVVSMPDHYRRSKPRPPSPDDNS